MGDCDEVQRLGSKFDLCGYEEEMVTHLKEYIKKRFTQLPDREHEVLDGNFSVLVRKAIWDIEDPNASYHNDQHQIDSLHNGPYYISWYDGKCNENKYRSCEKKTILINVEYDEKYDNYRVIDRSINIYDCDLLKCEVVEDNHPDYVVKAYKYTYTIK